MESNDLFGLLELKYNTFNNSDFIEHDPISIPHKFSKKQDIEIMAFWASMLAWGQRKTIINKCNQLVKLMDNAPHDFILNHEEKDLKKFFDFKHRTFNATDSLYFIHFFKHHYSTHTSLESAFYLPEFKDNINTEQHLIHFHNYFFGIEDAPERTRKHIATPARKSACKRLSMFLRWMVRHDEQGVDFGIWKNIKTSQLVCPLDVHVERIGRRLNLITRKQTDWKTALELTQNLKKYDPIDPVKYDFALFGIGIEEKV